MAFGFKGGPDSNKSFWPGAGANRRAEDPASSSGPDFWARLERHRDRREYAFGRPLVQAMV